METLFAEVTPARPGSLLQARIRFASTAADAIMP